MRNCQARVQERKVEFPVYQSKADIWGGIPVETGALSTYKTTDAYRRTTNRRRHKRKPSRALDLQEWKSDEKGKRGELGGNWIKKKKKRRDSTLKLISQEKK